MPPRLHPVWRRRLAWATLLVAFLALLPTSGRAQSSLVWVTNYYTVTGASFPAILESIDRARPPKLAPPLTGLTEWRIAWKFNVRRGPEGFYCDDFRTRTTITNTLPYWRAPTNATYTLKQDWIRYEGRLARHEVGHAQFALAALDEMRKQVKTAGSEPSYEAVNEKINSLAEAVLAHYRQLEVDYDRRTAHGTREPRG